MYNSILNIAGFTDPSQQKSDFTDLTGSFGDAFAASTPAPGGDDPQAIERAEEWLYSERSPDAAGDDRFPTAVAIGIVVRDEFKLSLPAAQYLVECWNSLACMPRLTPSEITQATEIAYFQPELAERIARGEGQAPLTGAQSAPTSPPTGREPTARADDVGPPGAIAATTAPSSLAAAALVTTTTPDLAVNTPPECALCAARRKAKRERTRRWRATRNATQPARTATGVANG